MTETCSSRRLRPGTTARGEIGGAPAQRAIRLVRWPVGQPLASREHDVVALAAQHLDDHVAVVALELDDAALRRAADAAALLQAPGELAEAGVVERHARDRRDRLPAPPGDLAPHLHATAAAALRRPRLARLAHVALSARPDNPAIAHAQDATPLRRPMPVARRRDRVALVAAAVVTPDEIGGVALFAALDAAQREQLSRVAADVSLAVGEYAADEGADRALFAVLEGRIEPTRLVDGIERALGVRHPGEVFGEVPIALGTSRSASVRRSRRA